MVLGAKERTTGLYPMVYRKVAHRDFKHVCTEIKKHAPTQKYQPYVPASGWDVHIRAFAIASIELQVKRHNADYDPLARFTIVDSLSIVDMAADAIIQFSKAPVHQRKIFLTLLFCPPR